MDDRLCDFRIVKMESQHIAAVAEMERTCFRKPWPEEALVEELSNPLAVFYVALCDGETVAYIGMHHIIDEGYLCNLAVKPEYRGLGIARCLLETLDDYAKENELAFISLEVRKSNHPAIELYTACNYKKEGARKDFYTLPREDAFIMTKHY